MPDQNTIEILEGILNQTLADKRHLVAKLRAAESEIESLQQEIASLDNRATAIDGALATMRSGGRSMTILDDRDSTQLRSEPVERYSNIREVPSRDYRRDNSVAYFDQSRLSAVRHSDFEPASNRFSDRTITQSCTLLLREAGGPLHVNELYKLLLAGGMKFKGNNPTISVAVSLSRNSRFRKVDPGTFDLVMREAMQIAS